MEEAECNRRGESKILTVFRLFIIEFLSLYHTEKTEIVFHQFSPIFYDWFIRRITEV